MPGEQPRRIKQQPIDDSNGPFPPLDGLAAPSRLDPVTPLVHHLHLQRVYGRTGEQLVFRATLSASPFHGVLRLALMRGDGQVSQSFHNGKGPVAQDSTLGGYGDEVADILTSDPRLDNLRICWTVRNPERFSTVTLELFGRDRLDPRDRLWSLTWDADQIAAHIRQDAPPPGPNGSAPGRRPIPWTGSLACATAVEITDDQAFPDGQLTAEHGPYQLRMTIDNNDPSLDPNQPGYPLVAWTYLNVVTKGWLGVQVMYQGMPLVGIPVQFYTLTKENQQDSQIGEQVTDASGSAYLPEAVETGDYGCAIDGQPLALISSVDDPSEPPVLTLPIGQSPVDVYGLLGDDLDAPEEDEEPAETEEEGEPLPEGVEAKGWLWVRVLYQGIPLAGMSVRFYTPTASQIGEEQVTDADGNAYLEEAVEMGYYGCLIEGQQRAIVSPVGNTDQPFVLTLPIGEPPADVYGPIGDALDEMDEEETSELETV